MDLQPKREALTAQRALRLPIIYYVLALTKLLCQQCLGILRLKAYGSNSLKGSTIADYVLTFIQFPN